MLLSSVCRRRRRRRRRRPPAESGGTRRLLLFHSAFPAAAGDFRCAAACEGPEGSVPKESALLLLLCVFFKTEQKVFEVVCRKEGRRPRRRRFCNREKKRLPLSPSSGRTWSSHCYSARMMLLQVVSSAPGLAGTRRRPGRALLSRVSRGKSSSPHVSVVAFSADSIEFSLLLLWSRCR